MKNKEASVPEQDFSYFGIQASWGVTKHFGGIAGTNELAALCHIDEGKHILEVGCGTGVTTCHLVKSTGCQVTGVDLSGKMIEWARKRARRKGLERKIRFSIADAQYLPFADNVFDAVICESVTAFPENKQRAVSEYVRVTKAGGYVGMNEGTWVKASPPRELIEFIERSMGNARFLPAEGWQALLQNAGLTEITARTYEINALSQRINEMRGLDFQDRLDRLRGIKDFTRLYISSASFRKYAKEITPSMRIIKSLFTYLGYGVYVGRKEGSAEA